MNIIPDLEFRGLIYQATDLDGLAERLAAGPIVLYNGFDPTADSLTVGTPRTDSAPAPLPTRRPQSHRPWLAAAPA